jgi:hypothetical protein
LGCARIFGGDYVSHLAGCFYRGSPFAGQ